MVDRLHAARTGALGARHKFKPGKLPGQALVFAPPVVRRRAAKKKRPKQLCPVPGCKGLAAPVFGMVCAKHKGVAKAKIKKYREERRALLAALAEHERRLEGRNARRAGGLPRRDRLTTRERKLQLQYLGAIACLTGEYTLVLPPRAEDKGLVEASDPAQAVKKAKR